VARDFHSRGLDQKIDILSTSGGTTTGPISFMQMYNDITSSVRQGGVRRGANMGILHYNHPDILLFVIYKLDEFSLTNFNISVTADKLFFDQIKLMKNCWKKIIEEKFDFDALVAEVREAHQSRDLDLKLVNLMQLYLNCTNGAMKNSWIWLPINQP